VRLLLLRSEQYCQGFYLTTHPLEPLPAPEKGPGRVLSRPTRRWLVSWRGPL